MNKCDFQVLVNQGELTQKIKLQNLNGFSQIRNVLQALNKEILVKFIIPESPGMVISSLQDSLLKWKGRHLRASKSRQGQDHEAI